jgi:transglutaminase-like putative cysteine protease
LRTLAVSCLRSLEPAVRCVGGYLETKPPPGKPGIPGAEASNAWFSVCVPAGMQRGS